MDRYPKQRLLLLLAGWWLPSLVAAGWIAHPTGFIPTTTTTVANHKFNTQSTTRAVARIRTSLPRCQSLCTVMQRRLSSLVLASSTGSSSTTLSHEEIRRYSRHLVLSSVGMNGQERIKNASILVIGAGGLGSVVLLYLAAAGIGHIGIVDADTVDETNLQRQIIHSVSTIGISKCTSATQRMHDINPHIHIRQYNEEFTSSSAIRIVSQGYDLHHPWDLIIDGSDNFPTKYLINDVCAMHGIPWIYSAILGFEGQVAVFNVPQQQQSNDGGPATTTFSPDYRDLLPTPPPPGDVPSCAEGGVLGVLPGTMGCLQATEAIKYILGHVHGLLIGRVLVFDAMKMKFNEVGIQRSLDREPITQLIDYQGFCAGHNKANQPSSQQPQLLQPAQHQEQQLRLPGQRTMDEVEPSSETEITVDTNNVSTFHSIAPKACWEKFVSEKWTPYVIDVRLQTEHDICCLPFTDEVVPHRTVRRQQHIPQTGDVLIYCKAGSRGATACRNLIAAGVDPNRLYNLQGGILQWQTDVDPSLPRY